MAIAASYDEIEFIIAVGDIMEVKVFWGGQVLDTRQLGLLCVFTDYCCFELEALSKLLALCLVLGPALTVFEKFRKFGRGEHVLLRAELDAGAIESPCVSM